MEFSTTASWLSRRDKAMLSRAAQVANTGTEKHMHGAVLYKSGRVLSVGVNVHRNSHPTMEIPYGAYTVHAEQAALRAVGDAFERGSTLYVVRVGAKSLLNSHPCNSCIVDLICYGIDRVVFSSGGGLYGELRRDGSRFRRSN